MNRPLALVIALLAISVCHTGQAAAQSYEETVERGVREFSAGNWEEAYVNFRRAQDLRPGPRPLRGMGMALYEQKQYADAVMALEQALAIEESEHPFDDATRTAAQSLLDTAKAYVATLVLTVTPGEAKITLDGRSVQSGSMYIDSGEHTVRASYGGREQERKLKTRLGESYEIKIDLSQAVGASAEPTPASPSTGPTPAESRGIGSGPVVLFVVAGLGIATFAVFGPLAMAEHGRLDEDCGGSCNDEMVADLDTYNLVADVGLGVGILAAAAGFWLWSAESGDSEGVAFAPWVGPSGAGVVARGSL